MMMTVVMMVMMMVMVMMMMMMSSLVHLPRSPRARSMAMPHTPAHRPPPSSPSPPPYPPELYGYVVGHPHAAAQVHGLVGVDGGGRAGPQVVGSGGQGQGLGFRGTRGRVGV